MQVSQVQETTSHAILGGGDIQECGMAESAEFFHMLSSAIYTDQKLAVVREVMCNAWDAHIVAGITNKPIRITVDQDFLTIQDFGPGIPHEKIRDIYGVYGNSTKKSDGKQTGGFGLGSKSPWAYQDDFEVTNTHKGVRAIYIMTKQNVETGKPAIIKMVDMPSDENGVKVKIKIKMGDTAAFIERIKRVAFLGEISARLNGNALRTLGISQIKSGFILLKNEDLGDRNSKIFIRYGNVVYPVPSDHDEIKSEYKAMTEIMHNAMGDHYYTSDCYKAILMAEPHSILVTPSRESLSMQSKTVATLKTLIKDFIKNYAAAYLQEYPKVISENIERLVAEGKTGHLLSADASVTRSSVLKTARLGTSFTDMVSVAREGIIRAYPGQTKDQKNLLIRQIQKAIDCGYGNEFQLAKFRDFIKSTEWEQVPWRKYNNRGSVDKKGYAQRHWWHREILAPLLTDIQNTYYRGVDPALVMKHQNFLVYDPHMDVDHRISSGFINAQRYQCNYSYMYVPLFRNFVVLTHNRRQVSAKVKEFPEFKGAGHEAKFFVYVTIIRTEKHLNFIRNFFLSRGFKLLDMTQTHAWEKKLAPIEVVSEETTEDGTTEAKKTVRRVGLLKLSNAIKNMGTDTFPHYQALLKEDGERSQTPEYYLRISSANKRGRIQFSAIGDNDQVMYLLKNYGELGVVAMTSSHEQRLKAKGLPSAEIFFMEKIAELMKASPTIIEWWKHTSDRYVHAQYNVKLAYEYDVMKVFRAITTEKHLMKEFGILDNRNSEEIMICNIWNKLSSFQVDDEEDTRQNFITELKAISIAPALQKIVDSIKDSRIPKFLDMNTILRSLRHTRGIDKDRDADATVAMKLLKQAVNG